jgi:arabinogalactan endo-1,4-beta-galactosidase
MGGGAELADIRIEKVPGLSQNSVCNVDISNIITVERTGTVFKDTNGAPQDAFINPAEGGVSYIQINVKLDPQNFLPCFYKISQSLKLRKSLSAGSLAAYADGKFD